MTESPMDRALELAREARGTTRPNPPVGAVLVKNGRIVGEGRTQPAGGPHAESLALRAAGHEAAGATLYVTLEPCTHWGRTPPCVDALLASGIVEAHVAVLDPNPLVYGEGIRRLQEAGIAVTVGEGSEVASELIAAHGCYITQHRPLVILVGDGPSKILEEVRASADLVVEADAAPPSDPLEWLRDLARCQITSIAVPAGSALGDRLLADGLVDRVVGAWTPAESE